MKVLLARRSLKACIWLVGVVSVAVMTFSVHDLVLKHQPSARFVSENTLEDEVPTHKYIVEPDYKVIVNNTKSNYTLSVSKDNSSVLDGRPITHVGFLKVHKAASTTTQAIFLRFGWRRNLTFVLPPEYNKFGYPNIISLNESVTKYNTLPPPPGKSFDILCHHVVYGKHEWGRVLPSYSAIVGTVREPFSLFKSILNYFQPGTIQKIERFDKDPIRRFLVTPTKYDSKNPRLSFLNNRLAFEYGVDPKIITSRNVTAFNDYLHNVLDIQFKVVILAKRFDEGLVMVKRKLNWTLNDILYAIKNVRNVKKPDRFKVTDDLKDMHREFARFDYLLYEFFEAKFIRQTYEEGPSFQREVEHFKKTREMVEKYCHTKGDKKPFKVAESDFNQEFEVTKYDCDLMHKGEIMFTQMIRKEQYRSATWGVKKAS
ncbi:galactosylceramide sulfotransferase-like [Mya arenaria]|uniref:galactosylceramide sulfotransferase-like n=1 Tax=Mya arenaria TaxID=6604 RepID=UPI0022E5B2B8|nr:galactosylceramide sulfotransferase-like [Mya arenaria]XP_052760675.1 galactosylceramide sulfotransferase-like [Mya arenaria]XP_052760679.1 galactosylceramide sulfotransferase-like [Mya arenaria]